jgi:hypothetical protein
MNGWTKSGVSLGRLQCAWRDSTGPTKKKKKKKKKTKKKKEEEEVAVRLRKI